MAELSTEEQSTKSASPEMQESWVDVKGQQQEGTLVHSHSKEEMEQLLASAASEEELSDADVVYQVSFQASESVEEEQLPQFQVHPVSEIITKSRERAKTETKIPKQQEGAFGARRRGILTFLVPVLLLTHLAMFGIGYYIGRRMSTETVMKVFHI